MTTSGRLFASEDLDELRQNQRETLRMVRDDVLERCRPASHADTAVETDLLELELRQLAEEYRVELDGILQAMAEARRSAQLADFLNAREGELFAHDVHRLRRGAAKRDRPEPEGSKGDALRRFLALLVWADELAGDYTDPRLTESRRH